MSKDSKYMYYNFIPIIGKLNSNKKAVTINLNEFNKNQKEKA